MLRRRTNSLRHSKGSDADEAPLSNTTESDGPVIEDNDSASDTESVDHPSPVPPRPIRQTETALSTAWVVALVSPLVNWLTGTDHVMSFLLILLLIYYLHQVVEVPWNLYQNACRRGGISSEHTTSPAVSELRKLELLFLGISMISPFLGASVLRFASQIVLGKDVISWFSISLFVLATGVRPWRQLVHRLEKRTHDLQNAVHYCSDGKATMDDVSARLDKLERAFQKFKTYTKEELVEVYDYAEEAVDVLDKSGRRLERRSDRNDERIKLLEEELEALKKAQKREALMHVTTHSPPSFKAIVSYYLPDWLPTIAGMHRKIQPISPSSPPPAKYPRSFSPSSSRLTTIPEETPQESYSSISYLSWLPGSIFLVRIIGFITLPLRALTHFISSHS